MKEWKRNLALLGVLVVGIGAAGFYALPTMSSQNYEETKSTETSGIQIIDIEGYAANVNVTPGPDSQATAHFHGYGRSDVYSLKMQTNGDTLHILIDHPDQQWNFGSNSLTLDVVIPQRDFDRLTVNTASGDIHLQDLKAKALLSSTGSGNQDVSNVQSDTLALDTASGDLNVENTSATLDLKTASGNITGHRLTGKKISADCASGDINLGGLTGEIKTRVMSGNINLDYDKLSATLTAYTASGDVNVDLPNDSSFDLHHKSASGDFNSNFAMNNMTNTNHEHKGTVGSGATAVNVETVSGNLTVHKK
ncbi:DUF4097 family beta strand repeat protein [Tumebacillus sp. ITR2]|uniref:DUF4097 family beta strand repeat protein n=1 Tax=Tumebacillus amylolyticus TaxID=2801339 RepID=A0ABS1J6K4_9BACL|nr:DUF4097 family beta strand repeat-containing protein [Tumebacillus amylolyticus]MBL0385805.1 DUF4097 family beta strand repeat protein [Tumebacillus amylolyticus]